MGAGKSSVGRALAQRLNWLFDDLDEFIERREGRKISEIFDDSGEPYFREIEHQALRKMLEAISEKPGRVVALGGGAFAQPRNAVLLKQAGLHLVHLDAPVEVLWERCSKQGREMGINRPLLREIDQFRKLYRVRRKSYRKAAASVQTHGRDVEQIAAEIVDALPVNR